MGKKTPEELVEEFCKEHGANYKKIAIEQDPVWNFLDGDFSTTPDVLLGKKLVYYHAGGPEIKIYVMDEAEKRYAMLTVWSEKAIEGILKLKQRMHEAKGLEILIATKRPSLSDYQEIKKIEDLHTKKN